MSDKKISCRKCGAEFTFTVGEQEWFAERELQEPRNCKACREKIKEEKKLKNSFVRQEDNQKAA